jgi:hypothetical protein
MVAVHAVDASFGFRPCCDPGEPVTVGVLSRHAAVSPETPRRHRAVALLSGVLDAVSDFAVLAFACWTVLYHVALIFHVRTNPVLLVWALSLPVLVLILRRPVTDPASWTFGATANVLPRRLCLPALVLSVVSAFCVAFGGTSPVWWLGWALAVGAALLGLLAVARHVSTSVATAREPASMPGTLLAAAAGIGLGAFSLFTLRGSADDAFYVNRAAWVADHGTLATRDTMFSNQSLPAIRGAGVPVASIESLQGAVAHVLHLAGGSVAYLVTPPIATFLAVWAVWRLIRSWAPRRAMWCFPVAIVYLLTACAGRATLGKFFITQANEGKTIYVSMLVPLIYLYLTRWTEFRERRTAYLLIASGVTAIGLTSSATFLVPLLCAAVALSLVVVRQLQTAVGALLPAAYPIGVGLVVHFMYSEVDNSGVYYTEPQAMRYVFGHSWFAVIGWLAVLSAVWVTRAGAAKLVTAGIAAVLLVVLAPGAMTAMNALTGTHAVIWRTMWVAPIPALVGLLAAVPVPHRMGWGAPLASAGLSAALIVVGAPLWSPGKGTHFVSRPSWHYSAAELQRARELVARNPNGPVLAPPPTMRAVTLLTTRIHPVSPLLHYVIGLDEPATQKQARLLLVRLITGGARNTPPSTVRFALDVLDVSLVCGLPEQTHRKQLFISAGYVKTRGISGEWCLRRPS